MQRKKALSLKPHGVSDSLLQVEVLQEEVTYATEEVERLTKVLDEQSTLLQALQEQTGQKDVVIQNLKQKVELDRQTFCETNEDNVIRKAFCHRCNNSKKQSRKPSEMEASNLLLSCHAHPNPYLA